MRFLHTSDWHLGKNLRGRSRAEEHESALSEILDIVKHERIDCVLITGDIFDSQSPPPDAERLAFNFFSRLRELGSSGVVIAGNHDHPKRLAAVQDILSLLGIYIRPNPARPSQGGLIEIEKNGEKARVAVLPFLTAGKIEDATALMAPEEKRYQAYSDRVGVICDALTDSFSVQTINLLLGHMYVDGSETSRSEREIHIAKPYAVSAQRFPSTAHYIALGHLHRPQEVNAPSPTHYAGSILQLDFGEREQKKRVVIIDAHPGKPATIESIPLSSGRQLTEVKGTFNELQTRAGTCADDWLRVILKLEKPVPGINDQIKELFPNALEVKLDYPPTERQSVSLSGTDPVTLFTSYYTRQRGGNPADEVISLFSTLYEEAIANATD
jgi:DNA repair protein SbcD/Mre11